MPKPPSIFQPPPEYRQIGDAVATRQAIFDNVRQAFTQLPTISNKNHTLSLADIDYDGPDHFSLAEQKKAIIEGQTLSRRLRGTVRLADPTGNVLDERRVTLAKVPYMNDSGAFTLNGTDFSFGHQLRLRPGIFTREKQDGTIDSHINVAKGYGHHYHLDPEKGVFRAQFGQAHLPLLPILRALGTNDADIRAAWGPALYGDNQKYDDPRVVQKLYAKIKRGATPRDEQDLQETIRKAFDEMTLDPEVTSRTLGKPYDKVTPEVILATTGKLLRVFNREEEGDDRDAMAYQRLVGPEDIFAARVKLGMSDLRKAFWRASFQGNLKKLPPGVFDKAMRGAILDTGLGNPGEEVSPLELLDHRYRVTRMGEGGLPGVDSIPASSRDVQPGQLGFTDAIQTAESLRIGIDNRLPIETRKGRDGRIYSRFTSPGGEELWLSPQDVADKVVSFPGELASGAPYVRVIKGGRLRYVPRQEVHYELGNMTEAFGPMVNLVPLANASKPQRVSMGARYLTQALALPGAEVPLVQAGIPGQPGKSFEDLYGEAVGAIRAKDAGTVVSVSPDEMQIKTADGQLKTVELNNLRPYNRKSLLHNTPLVRAGQQIQPGQLLAKSNYTDDNGSLAIGLNARIGFISARGLNFEDAIVISEDFARRSASEHLYQHDLDLADTIHPSRGKFASIFPAKYDRKTLAKYDEDGVIKPGETVEYGQPLILAIKERKSGPRLGRQKATWGDASVFWEHHSPGTVTAAFKGKHAFNVAVRAVNPTEEGDKVSNRYGGKGVVHIVPTSQMPIGEDGKPLEVLLNPVGLISRGNSSQVLEASLGKIAAQTGQPYKVSGFDQTKDLRRFVADEIKKHGIKLKETLTDPKTGRKIPGVLVGNMFLMKLHHSAAGKLAGRATGSYSSDEVPAKGGDEGCFFGAQRIKTSIGDIRISTICEKQLGLQVRTWNDESREWVYRPIVDWFTRRAAVSDLLTIKYIAPCEVKKGDRIMTTYTEQAISCTKNHEICLFDGSRKAAGELHAGDQLVGWGVRPTRLQMAAMLGTMLGDASCKDDEFRFEHSVKQKTYVHWKRSLLTGLAPKTIDCTHAESAVAITQQRIRGGKSRLVYIAGRHITEPIHRMTHVDGKKTITARWLKNLNGLSVALWVLDDGSISSKGTIAKSQYSRLDMRSEKFAGRLCTQGFDMRSLDMLRVWLMDRYGETCSVDKLGQMNIPTRMCRKLMREVARWVPWQMIPKSKECIRRWAMRLQAKRPPREIKNSNRLTRIPVTIREIKPFKPDKAVAHINVYDFTVADTGTYCAGAVLVSNSKRVGGLESAALLAHGAFNVLRDVNITRGQRNEDHWQRVMSGNAPPPGRVPYVYRKFLADLTASGIYPVRRGSKTQLYALTDKTVDELAQDRNLQNAETVDWRVDRLTPVTGGLFDERLTGGHGHENKWSAIPLHEPMPNPVWQDPIRHLLGMTEDQFRNVLSGRESLSNLKLRNPALRHYGRGPDAMRQALADMDVDREIERARAEITGGKKTYRADAIRRLGYLKAAKETGVHPGEWFLHRVPVLPPAFRPVSVMGNTGQPLIADSNALYRELFDANEALKDLSGQVADVGDERLAVYDAFRGVVGLGDPIQPEHREQRVKGVLKSLFGSSPKTGSLQRKLISASVDLVGRGVITPDPELDMDHLGIPEEMAWRLYKPFVIRRLVRRGMRRLEAANAVDNRTGTAKAELQSEMQARPVMMTRAPVLHKFGIMAFWPQITSGKTVRTPPVVIGQMGGDYDGDAVNVHLPASDDAVQEAAAKMMPSKILFSPATFKPVFAPANEFVGGLYSAATAIDHDKPPRVFASRQDAINAFRRGELSLGQRVEIVDA